MHDFGRVVVAIFSHKTFFDLHSSGIWVWTQFGVWGGRPKYMITKIDKRPYFLHRIRQKFKKINMILWFYGAETTVAILWELLEKLVNRNAQKSTFTGVSISGPNKIFENWTVTQSSVTPQIEPVSISEIPRALNFEVLNLWNLSSLEH